MSRADYEKILDPSNPMPSEEVIKKLREMILRDGLPDTEGVCYFITLFLIVFVHFKCLD